MKEAKYSKVYFGHFYVYYQPGIFAFPIAAFIDGDGISLCFAFFGFVWSWRKFE